MSSLPVLPVLSKKGQISSPNGGHSFLKINSMPQRPVRKSLERQAIESLHNKHYIYIDFQMNNSLIELDQQRNEDYESEDEVEKLGGSSISGMNQLQKLCLPSFRMHKFLSEERRHIEKRRNWKRLLGQQSLRDTMMDFEKLKEKVSPQVHFAKLQQFLQSKDIEQQWRRIVEREQQLFDHQMVGLSGGSQFKGAASHLSASCNFRPRLNSRFKLKSLNNFNELLRRN